MMLAAGEKLASLPESAVEVLPIAHTYWPFLGTGSALVTRQHRPVRGGVSGLKIWQMSFRRELLAGPWSLSCSFSLRL